MLKQTLCLAATLAALTVIGGRTGAQAPPAPPPPPLATPMHHGSSHHLRHATPSQAPLAAGEIIGNKKTHTYHMAGDKGTLPALQNRVSFRTEAEAQAAGYHRVGTPHSKTAHPGQHKVPATPLLHR